MSYEKTISEKELKQYSEVFYRLYYEKYCGVCPSFQKCKKIIPKDFVSFRKIDRCKDYKKLKMMDAL